MSQTYFDAKLLRTDGNGVHQSFSGSSRLRVLEDRVVLDREEIRYPEVVDFSAERDHLQLIYVNQNGERVERHFCYVPFLQWRAPAALKQATIEVNRLRALSPASPAVASVGLVRASRDSDQVVIRSSKVAFPAVCPVCCDPAETIGKLSVSTTFAEGSWFVPACKRHTASVSRAIRPQKWKQNANNVAFTCESEDYAGRLLVLNSSDEVVPADMDSPLANQIASDARVVLFQYVLSGGIFSLLRTSRAFLIPARRLGFGAGLPYSLLSGIAGWWGIPWDRFLRSRPSPKTRLAELILLRWCSRSSTVSRSLRQHPG
jgi:hypothetical protein